MESEIGRLLRASIKRMGCIYFLFISAKAMTTLEFLQQEWINDGNFMGLGNERDPQVGLQEEGATFTIPKRSGQTAHPRDSNIQRCSRRRIPLYAELFGTEMARRTSSMMMRKAGEN